MKDTDYFGKDKIKHFAVCLITSLLHPLFALGLALGKEYGDKNANGNHWCWWDILADTLGIVIGGIAWYLIWI